MYGRFINKGDIATNARVCLVDESFAKENFGYSNIRSILLVFIKSIIVICLPSYLSIIKSLLSTIFIFKGRPINKSDKICFPFIVLKFFVGNIILLFDTLVQEIHSNKSKNNMCLYMSFMVLLL